MLELIQIGRIAGVIVYGKRSKMDLEGIYRPAGSWVTHKRNLLRELLQDYTNEVSKNFKKYYYIDAFAGPGKNRIEETGEKIDGSPLIALKMKPPFTNYVFTEIDSDCYHALCNRVQKFQSQGFKIKVLRGDCNKVLLEEVLPKIPPNTPIFAFLDPEGLELKWETVKEFSNRMATILITFSTQGVMRCLPREETSEAVNQFFGTSREIEEINRKCDLGMLSSPKLRYTLLQLYKSQLAKYFKYINNLCSVWTEDYSTHLYYLLFASNHDLIFRSRIRNR